MPTKAIDSPRPCPYCHKPIAVEVEVVDITPNGPDGGYDHNELVSLAKWREAPAKVKEVDHANHNTL